jgi:transcriptional regulator with XRE-family HTH domain
VIIIFLGQTMAKVRKEQGFTQAELADGICKQNTISKIERHNIAPTIRTLIALCQRLGLTLNDVFSEFSAELQQEQRSLFASVEHDILAEQLTDANDKLSLVDPASLSQTDQATYHMYQALLITLNHQQPSAFMLDQILTETRSDPYNINTLIAYLLKAQNYVQSNQQEEAQYFISIIADVTQENIAIPDANTFQRITLCEGMAAFYLAANNLEQANKYAQWGVDINLETHQTLLLDRLLMILSKTTTDKATAKLREQQATSLAQLFQ